MPVVKQKKKKNMQQHRKLVQLLDIRQESRWEQQPLDDACGKATETRCSIRVKWCWVRDRRADTS
jgi:hypothetical protein